MSQPGPIDRHLMLWLRDEFGLGNFVETGTGRGLSTTLAASAFERVYTVEIDPGTHCHARPFLDRMDNVTAFIGSSPQVLAERIIPQLEGATFFWLDAHWSGGDKHGPECPLLCELDAIGGTYGRDVILIDDYRLFASPPPEPHVPHQWPTVDDIRELVRGWNDGTRFHESLCDSIALLPTKRP